ncbi:MAG TPA: YdcF family protein [Alphaproteobacteria bacterium]|nr:YdcF family protein [Alphaproteobacteria bacterium]
MSGFSLSYSFLMPPTIFIVLALAGALAALRWRRLGLAIALVSSFSLYVAATPALASWLLTYAARMPAVTAQPLSAAQAIIVLAGDIQRGNDADIPDRVGVLTLDRLAEGAYLYRKLRLPVLVTGGPVGGSHEPIADLMRDTLEGEFGVPVRWEESRSETTYENAMFSTQLLARDGISTAIIVTQAWHMPRAIWSFERAGLHAIPAPELRPHHKPLELIDLLPTAAAFHDSFLALHEILGGIYYRWRYG